MTQPPIVVDSSAIVVILLEEPEGPAFLNILSSSDKNLCSPVTFVECAMVLSTRAPRLSLERFGQALSDFAIDLVPINAEHAVLASSAFIQFGEGRHPAKLNLGDCFSYALAKSLNAPLLFKGDDFSQTDIVPAIAAGAAGP